MLIALDRMERGGTDDNLLSALGRRGLQAAYGLPVISIASLTDLLEYLRTQNDPTLSAHFAESLTIASATECEWTRVGSKGALPASCCS